VVPWRDEAQGLPILRKATMNRGVTEDPLPQTTFETIFKDVIKLSGYFGDPTIHAIRRDLGKELDSKSAHKSSTYRPSLRLMVDYIERYTPVQRSQYITQQDERVYGRSYVANTSSCDGKAAFLNEKP